jgi:type I protein arginine methyltransferase
MNDDARKALTRFDDFRTMLTDNVRMRAWEQAIRQVVRPGDTVVDLGAGTGILTFLALKAGARHVVAIEKSDAIELAKRVAAYNGWTDQISFHHASSMDVSLDHRADCLISETLGSFGIEENTLAFTADARERLLKPGGRMLPAAISSFLAPVDTPGLHHQRIGVWSNVSGIDMSVAAEEGGRRMVVAAIEPRRLVAKPAVFANIDLTCHTSTEVENRLRFVFPRDATVHGLAGWFVCTVADGIQVDTGPHQPQTHWKQAWFPFPVPVTPRAGDILDVVMQVGGKHARSDDSIVHYEWFCSQRDDDPSRSPCPCGSGRKFKRCCAQFDNTVS